MLFVKTRFKVTPQLNEVDGQRQTAGVVERATERMERGSSTGMNKYFLMHKNNPVGRCCIAGFCVNSAEADALSRLLSLDARVCV